MFGGRFDQLEKNVAGWREIEKDVKEKPRGRVAHPRSWSRVRLIESTVAVRPRWPLQREPAPARFCQSQPEFGASRRSEDVALALLVALV